MLVYHLIYIWGLHYGNKKCHIIKEIKELLICLYFNYIFRCDIVESEECDTFTEQVCETVPKIQCDSTEKAACTTIQVWIIFSTALIFYPYNSCLESYLLNSATFVV